MYKIISENLELPFGEEFITEALNEMEIGELYLFQIGSFLILGRWFPGWIIQAHRWIHIGRALVHVLGHVRHLL